MLMSFIEWGEAPRLSSEALLRRWGNVLTNTTILATKIGRTGEIVAGQMMCPISITDGYRHLSPQPSVWMLHSKRWICRGSVSCVLQPQIKAWHRKRFDKRTISKHSTKRNNRHWSECTLWKNQSDTFVGISYHNDTKSCRHKRVSVHRPFRWC